MSNQGKSDRQRRELMRLQTAVARQQAQIAQAQPIDTEAIKAKPIVGMPADIVLKLPGYAKRDRTSKPRVLGYDRNGLKVRWYYKDMLLTIKRLAPNGYYQVTEVKERQQNEEAQTQA